MGKGEHEHNVNDHWCTPPEVWEPLVNHFGHIGLDPFSNPNSQIPAKNKWSCWAAPRTGRKGTVWGIDSFEHCWDGWGLVYVNGPFSKASKWLEKCAFEGDEVVFLFKANMNARYVHRWVRPYANAIAFFNRRLTFLGAAYQAAFHVALGYRGPRPGLFEKAFEDRAWIFRQDHHHDPDRPATRPMRSV